MGRGNEWQPLSGTTFPSSDYLKRTHDNTHAKEIGDQICIQIGSLGFRSPVVSPTHHRPSLHCANVSAAVSLMCDRMLPLGQSWLTNGVGGVTM